jgi:hypothetical protein
MENLEFWSLVGQTEAAAMRRQQPGFSRQQGKRFSAQLLRMF